MTRALARLFCLRLLALGKAGAGSAELHSAGGELASLPTTLAQPQIHPG